MGQRLNLEIRKKNKVLANAYYHWSAYTYPAYSLASDAITYINNHYHLYKDSKLLAIRALEATGAGMNDEDLEYMKDFKTYFNYEFQKCKDRNEGILCVCPESIKSTQDWAEGTCILHIDDPLEITIDFNVISYYDSQEDYEADYCSDEDEIKEFRSKIVEDTFDDANLTEDEFDELIDIICNQGKYIKTQSGMIMSEFC